jgi:hypothetical protein
MSAGARRLLAGAALAVLLIVVWSWWRSPERRLYRRLDELMSRLEKDGDESRLASAATARGVLDFFAPGFLVRAAPYEGSLDDPQQLMGAVLRFRDTARQITIATSEREAILQESPPTATLGFVVTVTMDAGRGPGRERWRVRSLWNEQDGEWKIAELELTERLEGGLVLPF